MNKPLFLFWLMLWSYPGGLLCQDLRDFPVSSITVENGLPSNETFHVVEDQEGYIWIATDNGLSKFNGSQHKVFDNRHGLPSKSVYHLFLQKDTSIVGVCSNGQLFKIKNDKIEYLIKADTSKKYLKSMFFPFSYYQDENGSHHIGTRKGYFNFDHKSNLVKEDVTDENNQFVLDFRITEENSIFCYLKISTSGVNSDIQLKRNNQILGVFPVSLAKLAVIPSVYPSKNNKYTVLHLGLDLFIIDNNTEEVRQLKLKNECIGTYIDENTLYVLVKKSGMSVYDISNGELINKYRIFEGLSISSTLKSSNGIYWITTLENGLRMIDLNSPILVYQGQEDENITSFSVYHQPVIGFENGDMFFTSQQKTIKLSRKVFNIRHYKERFFVSSSYLDVFNDSIENINHYFKDKNLDQVRTHYFIPYNDSISIFFGNSHIQKWNMKSGMIEYPVYGGSKCYSGSKIGELCYISRSGDILIYDPISNDILSIEIPFKVIYFFEHNGEVFGLCDELKICKIKGGKVEFIDIPYADEINGIYDAVYQDRILHFSTNIGVYSWRLNQRGIPTEMINYEPISIVRNIEYFNDTLYYATNKAVLKKPASSFNIELPTLKIESIRTDSLEHEVNNDSLVLNYNQNDIEIELDHQSYSQPFLNYKYILVGNEKKYFYTSEDKITYSSLEPGDYALKASVTSDGINYSNELTIKITILPPFWKTWWFYTLIFLFIAGIIIWIILVQIRRIKRKAEFKQTISRLRAQALTAQLNPHMVFNVLNSIQGMVSESQIEESNIFISRFSKYLRNTLKFSKETSYSINDEINMTKSYLELEKLRFQKTIDFELKIELNNFHINVPPLITQPIIENAIKHGVSPLDQKDKRVNIRYMEEKEFLVIEVSDNGIGITERLARGDGLRITRERLNVLSPENRLDIVSYQNPTTFQLKIKK